MLKIVFKFSNPSNNSINFDICTAPVNDGQNSMDLWPKPNDAKTNQIVMLSEKSRLYCNQIKIGCG